eukprot:13107711-Alexandrium_andersonii.AAC.1
MGKTGRGRLRRHRAQAWNVAQSDSWAGRAPSQGTRAGRGSTSSGGHTQQRTATTAGVDVRRRLAARAYSTPAH